MDLSIIIISNDRKEYLKKCLNSIANQKLITSYQVEVIISVIDKKEVEDLSHNLVEDSSITWKIVCDTDSKTFNRSKARNRGLEVAVGNLILFLDCDILLNSHFVKKLLEKGDYSDNIVISPYLYGYKISIDDPKRKYIIDKMDEILSDKIDMTLDVDFSDFRDQVFKTNEIVNNPWIHVWSGILVVSRKLIDEIKGFDETFVVWGGEDTDFAIRLFKNDAEFIFDRFNWGIHMPHETNRGNGGNNQIKLHEKHQMIETELCCHFPVYSINEILSIIQSFYVCTPNYRQKEISAINKNLESAKRTLCVGINKYEIIEKLNFTNYFVTSKELNRYIDFSQNKKVDNLLGIATNYSDQYFDMIYLFDSYQCLPDYLVSKMIIELGRIGGTITIVDHGRTYFPIGKNLNSSLPNNFVAL